MLKNGVLKVLVGGRWMDEIESRKQEANRSLTPICNGNTSLDPRVGM